MWPFTRKTKSPQYIYGTCGKHGMRARKHTKTGAVQFCMWKAGEQGHTQDYWIDFNPYWWPSFKEDEGQAA